MDKSKPKKNLSKASQNKKTKSQKKHNITIQKSGKSPTSNNYSDIL